MRFECGIPLFVNVTAITLFVVGGLLLSVRLAVENGRTNKTRTCFSMETSLGYWNGTKWRWADSRCTDVPDYLEQITEGRWKGERKFFLFLGDSNFERLVLNACNKMSVTIYHALPGYAWIFSKKQQKRVRRKVNHWCKSQGLILANMYHLGFLNGTYHNHAEFRGQHTNTYDRFLFDLPVIDPIVNEKVSPDMIVLGLSGWDMANIFFPSWQGLGQRVLPFAYRQAHNKRLPDVEQRYYNSISPITQGVVHAVHILKQSFPRASLFWSTGCPPNILGPYAPENPELDRSLQKVMQDVHPDVPKFDLREVLRGKYDVYVDNTHFQPAVYHELMNLFIQNYLFHRNAASS